MKSDLRSSLRRHGKITLISARLRVGKEVAMPLKRGVFLAPATITSLGLLSGFYSIISAFDRHFELAALMIIVAFICDGLDGRVARISRTASQFGVEYDSLSDVVAFGVAPASLIYMFALFQLGNLGWVVCGAYVVCAALRLARFNVQVGGVDKRRFVGLPVPGAAAMIAGLVTVYSYFEMSSARLLMAVAAPLTLILACLMVSRVPYPSFKAIKTTGRVPLELLAGVLVVIAFAITLPQITVFVGATLYVLSGPYLMLRGEPLITIGMPGDGAEPGAEAEQARSQTLPNRVKRTQDIGR
jgi:CDP-diacylglycerol---serine O-phosphatidyltransferase